METVPSHDLAPFFPPRGISIPVLLFQVKNTVPFIFNQDFISQSSSSASPFLATLNHLKKKIENNEPDSDLSHEEYFKACLSAHYGTVASFVPTDVDSQIRFKLWHPALPGQITEKMALLVKESYHWDSRPVSTRWVRSTENGEILSGHAGEWLSTAVAAYAALRKKNPDSAADLGGLIVRELQKEAKIFQDLKKARDGIGLSKASALIAHNLGDLDRVIDQWNLPPEDVLRSSVYKAGHPSTALLSGQTLLEAGNLYKAQMAAENHRHFSLRGPKCLRQSADLLLPVGPFFDDWGRKIALHPGLNPKEVGSIVEALVDGWEKLKTPTLGYPRALAGILDTFPGGFSGLSEYIPARISRTLKSGKLRSLICIPKKRFEEQWNQIGLKCDKKFSTSRTQ